MFNPTIFFSPTSYPNEGYQCEMELSHYKDGNLAISLVSVLDGSPVAKATVNIEGVKLASNEVCIKDYSENAGMLMALQAAGIVESVVDVVQSGYVDVPVVTLTDNVMEVYETIDGLNNLRGVDNHVV